MTKPTDEQAAEAFARNRNPGFKYPRGSGSAVVHEALLCFLAGRTSLRAEMREDLARVRERVEKIVNPEWMNDPRKYSPADKLYAQGKKAQEALALLDAVMGKI